MAELLIQAQALRRDLAQHNYLVFDVRHDLGDLQAGRRAYLVGHIPGALYLDNETQLSAACTGRNGRHPLPDRNDFAALMHAHGLAPGVQVVVYDAGDSMFAAHLWWMLRWIGHEQVSVLDGGWQAWLDAGGESESGQPEPAPSKRQRAQGTVPTGSPMMPVVDAQAVLDNLDQAGFTVLDARAVQRYNGTVEPIDPVAGHIPGALNRPFQCNVQADGRFKPAQVLREEFLAVLGSRIDAGVVHQCGSGITACHNLFAMELAGLHGTALYPGSWSEWCSDPSRPVATGDAVH
ncbi:sulfurtransferase [Alcaligenaceae bacterium CGII-47]|nr:sulfurtransferase [Alcaligenaceae bacterium CGII-47]